MPTLLDSQIERVQAAFHERYASAPTFTIRAPGRVNLIGEHTDYNEGFVFPTAIDREVVIAASRRHDATVRLYSNNYQQEDSFSLDSFERLETGPLWSNYVRGVIRIVLEGGYTLGGFDAVLEGNVPQGAGLSSSAAIEVATGTLLVQLFGLNLTPKDVAVLAQRSENQFVGVQCGIMDPFISALGKQDHALMIDCRSLDYRAVPLHLAESGASIVIIDSAVQRGLVESQFNTRRTECASAVEQLRELLERPGLKSLREVDLATFEGVSSRLPAVVRQRARHVVTENARVLACVEALESGDLARFGTLMNQSHDSLRDDYNVSTHELDLLVSLCQAVPGVFGARMTGAGFGGCTVTLAKTEAIPQFRDQVLEPYREATGQEAAMFVCRAVDGATGL